MQPCSQGLSFSSATKEAEKRDPGNEVGGDEDYQFIGFTCLCNLVPRVSLLCLSFSTTMEAEKRDPGNKVALFAGLGTKDRWLYQSNSSAFFAFYLLLTSFKTLFPQVWVGQVGSATVQKLKSSVGPKKLSPGFHENRDAFTVSIFFDSGGGLQKVSGK